MIICDMCKKDITEESNQIQLWLGGKYREKICKLGFNHKPEFCSIDCAINYLSELKTIIFGVCKE